VWDQVIGTFHRIDRLARGQAGRTAFQAYARLRLRPVFDRLGWDAASDEAADHALLRASLIRALGYFGDEDILTGASRRFAAFVANPATLRAALRDPIAQIAGHRADRAAYDALLRLARASTNADERVRYYLAAASAHDPALAAETLAIALTDELPPNLAGTLISTVASTGEQPDLALEFVTTNFALLAARHGPQFRDNFVPNLMTNFIVRERADELMHFAPAQETAGGRKVAARAAETIRMNADLRDAILPAIDDWLSNEAGRQSKAQQAQ